MQELYFQNNLEVR